mgnify:CR=1 FL=1
MSLFRRTAECSPSLTSKGAAVLYAVVGNTLVGYVNAGDAGYQAGSGDRVVFIEDVATTAGQALGYRELFAHLAGATTLDDALDLAIRRTRRFARRQRSWFARDPRITWLSGEAPAELAGPLAATLGLPPA